MLKKIKLENTLFLDIETVPLFAKYSEIDETQNYYGSKKPIIKEKTNLHLKNFMIEQVFGQNLEKLSVYRLDILFLQEIFEILE